MEEIKRIRITKNRGWRGLAEVVCMDKDRDIVSEMVFSFSQDVWDDMMDGLIVIQDKDSYYVIQFDNTLSLPHGHQRSVLIKGFEANVTAVNSYKKAGWMGASRGADYHAILHFVHNKNNHTTSDWNYIGVRVTPSI